MAASWIATAVLMWRAGTAVPDAERLSHSVMAPIPTARSLLLAIGGSLLELLAVLAAVWPGWRRFWGMRLAAAGLGVLTWFIATTPMALNRVELVHRRWLALTGAALVAAAVAWGIGRVVGPGRGKGLPE